MRRRRWSGRALLAGFAFIGAYMLVGPLPALLVLLMLGVSSYLSERRQKSHEDDPE